VAHTCNPTQKAKTRRITVRSQPREIVSKTLSQKYPLEKELKVKALNSNPSTAKTIIIIISILDNKISSLLYKCQR
jgi:hypothetical protein